MRFLARLIRWLQDFYQPPRNRKTTYFILKTFQQRDFCALALVRTDRKREIATYRAIPRYPVSPKIEIWIFCDHLYKIPKDKGFKVTPGCNHALSVFFVPIGAAPSNRNCVFYRHLDLKEFASQIDCSSIFTQMVATALIHHRHDEINWENHVEKCQKKALAQVAAANRSGRSGFRREYRI
jgi:hypothetical protein